MPAFGPFLAVRYLVTRPIMLLGIAGVAFAVWAMLLVDAVFSGFVEEIREDVRRSTATLLVTDLPVGTSFEALRVVLEADQDVQHTAPRLRHYGLLQSRRESLGRPGSSEVDWNQMEGGFALLLGIDPAREMQVTGLVDWLPAANAKYEQRRQPLVPPSRVLQERDPARLAELRLADSVEYAARRRAGLPIPDDLADFRSQMPGMLLSWRRRYYMPWLSQGDPIDLLCAGFSEARGELRPTNARLAFAGYFATGHRLFDEATAMLPIETLRTLLGHDRDDPDSIDLITDVAVQPQPGRSPAQLRACQQRLRAAVATVLPAGSPPCSVLDWEQQNEVFLGAIAHEHKLMQFVLFVVMMVAAFVIYATLHMMVMQKVKDIGILLAIGGSPRGIGLVFLLCGAVVGGVGVLLGTAIGTLSAHYLNDINDWLAVTFQLELFPKNLFDLPSVPCRMESAWVVQVAIGAFLLALLVAFLPARKASRWHPVQALSYE